MQLRGARWQQPSALLTKRQRTRKSRTTRPPNLQYNLLLGQVALGAEPQTQEVSSLTGGRTAQV